MGAMRTIRIEPSFEAWQAAARALLAEGVEPAEVTWSEAPPGAAETLPAARAGGARVPRQFLDLARQAAGARDPQRWALLYETLWRIVHENHDLLKDPADRHVRRLKGLAAQAWREGQKAEVEEMLQLEAQGGGARSLVPAGAALPELREAATRCTGCDLYRHAT